MSTCSDSTLSPGKLLETDDYIMCRNLDEKDDLTGNEVKLNSSVVFDDFKVTFLFFVFIVLVIWWFLKLSIMLNLIVFFFPPLLQSYDSITETTDDWERKIKAFLDDKVPFSIKL